MANPVQPQGHVRVHQPQEEQQVRAPRGVGASPTTIASASEPQSCTGIVESFLIRLKDLLVWLFQWVFCSKPSEETPASQPAPQQAQPVVVQQPPIEQQRRVVNPPPGSRQENMLLLLRLQQKSDLEQQHILIQIGNEIYAKSGPSGFYTYFRQSPELIGRNAIAANPQLLKPFLQ